MSISTSSMSDVELMAGHLNRSVSTSSMSGMEFITRLSLTTVRSNSRHSLFPVTDLPEDIDEKTWSLSSLNKQFRLKNAEQLFHKYQIRLQHALFRVLLMLNTFYFITIIIVYFAFSKDYSLHLVPIIIRIVCLLCLLALLVASFKEKLFRSNRARILAASSVVLLVVAGMHGSSLYMTLQNKNAHTVRNTFTIVIISCLLLPFPKKYQCALAAAFITAAELAMSGVNYVLKGDGTFGNLLAADGVFYFAGAFVGIYIRFLVEIMSRRAFLDRRESFESKIRLEINKEQEEKLLLSILPPHIAVQVRNDLRDMCRRVQMNLETRQSPFSQLYVEHYRNASILYADIVNSMLLTVKLEVNALVQTLNQLFGRFDDSAEKSNCLRIKLLGDCYYCVSGVPEADPHHADNCVQMGLDMIDIIRSVREEQGVDVDMRIGVHSGNLLSGLIGIQKWQFDIWSRDVTIASKMEQSGVPGQVHITKATRDQLTKEFHIHPGNGHFRDEFIAQEQLETFLITPAKKKQSVFLKSSSVVESLSAQDVSSKVPRHFRHQSSTPTPQKCPKMNRRRSSAKIDPYANRRTTVLDYSVHNFRRMLSEVNKNMEDALENMAIDKKNHWFKSEGIHPLFLMFRKRKEEKNYIKEVDPLFKHYLLCAFIIFMSIATIHMIAMPLTQDFWILFVITLVIIVTLCVASWTGYLWRWIKRNSPPPTKLPTVLKLSRRIWQGVLPRMAIWFIATGMIQLCSMWGLKTCFTPVEQNRTAVELNRDGEMLHAMECNYPWYYTFCAALALSTTSVFLRINYIFKLFINLLAIIMYSVVIFRSHEVFANRNIHYIDWSDFTIRSDISHCLYLVLVVIGLHIIDRQVEYMCRLDYLWKKKLRAEQKESEMMEFINWLLLENILPSHVADYFLSKDNSYDEELYHEEYNAVAVMFASIPDFTNFYTEDQMNEEGRKCIQLLNEIICDFDKMLYEDRFQTIDKIKTIGSTYMAAAGLRGMISEEDGIMEENPLHNVMTLVSFATQMMAVLQQMNKDALQDFRLRIGISVGPVIAGVVGSVKPQYDIWGDTVNVASRMDSTGVMGRIHVTEEVADIVKKSQKYECECRGKIAVKGKGMLTTYLLKTPYDEPDFEESTL